MQRGVWGVMKKLVVIHTQKAQCSSPVKGASRGSGKGRRWVVEAIVCGFCNDYDKRNVKYHDACQVG